MKIKTQDLIGPALDWAVAKCVTEAPFDPSISYADFRRPLPHYSTDWSQGGPIIERESIALDINPLGGFIAVKPRNIPWVQWQGSTALTAAMRCYVASKLGDEVDVPEGLL